MSVTLTPTHVPVVAHAAERWADAIVRALDANHDVRTLTDWGRQLSVSESQLRSVCDGASVATKASLDFLRLLRVLLVARRIQWEPTSLLDADPRTIRSLFERAGVGPFDRRGGIPDIGAFLVEQRLVMEAEAVDAVRRRLAGRGVSVGA